MRKRKSKAIKLNFDGVESGGKALPDGKYLAEITSGEQKEGSDSGKPYIEWKFKVVEGKHKGAVVFDNTSLQPQALFRLRGLLEVIGFEFPEDEEFEFDPSDVAGEQLTIHVINETYDGRERPKVSSYGAADEAEEAEEEEEDEDEEKPKKKKKSKKDEDEEEEDEDEEDEDEEIPPKKKKGKEPTFEEGDKVTFYDEETKKSYKGKITEIDEDGTATVDVKGEEWQVDTSELEAA